MDVLEAIYTRRSVREFTDHPVSDVEVAEILKAGSWAPSGLNNQPWRFVVVRDPGVKGEMARLTKYRKIVDSAPVVIPVFIDRGATYNDTKDHQGIGACLQNMLLAAHGCGLGAVWLGEILNRGDEVRTLLGLGESLELMAVVALGKPAPGTRSSRRKALDELILKTV
jgi:nitroreductase